MALRNNYGSETIISDLCLGSGAIWGSPLLLLTPRHRPGVCDGRRRGDGAKGAFGALDVLGIKE